MAASSPSADPWSRGVYLIPDAIRILRLPGDALRTWVSGRNHEEAKHFPAGRMEATGTGRDRHFGFLTLVELYLIAQLRQRGVSMATIHSAREELTVRYQTPHPFALGGILSSGKRLVKELGDEVLLELGTQGQTALTKLVEPFCARLDFDGATCLARRFYPLGRESPVVVDPRQAFGRPSIAGTNVTTEAVQALLRGGEAVEDVADALSISLEAVQAARAFETHKKAA